MKYRLLTAVLAISLSAGTCMVSMADQGPGVTTTVETVTDYSIRRNPEDLTTSEIIDELYANVSPESEFVRNTARTSSMILTGELPATLYGDTGHIGGEVCDSEQIMSFSNVADPLASHRTKTAIIKDNYGEKYMDIISIEDYPTEEKIAENRRRLNLLYNTVWDIKEATTSLTDVDKVNYIMDYLENNYTYQKYVVQSAGVAVDTKIYDCDSSSGLFYIIGLNCGLKVRCTAFEGRVDGHMWNEVLIDNEWKIVDVAQKRRFSNYEFYNSVGYTPMVTLY